jgi:hypothetical protein
VGGGLARRYVRHNLGAPDVEASPSQSRPRLQGDGRPRRRAEQRYARRTGEAVRCASGQITAWKDPLLTGAAGVFGPGAAAEPVVDVKTLHAQIGALALENDFLEHALGKAGC